jgi:hypothetical protein
MQDRDHTASNAFGVRRPAIRRRLLDRLRPEGGSLALNLNLLEIVAELDPGMIDWRPEAGTVSAGSAAVLAHR